MNAQFTTKLSHGIAIAAFFTFGVANLAHADGANTYNEGGISSLGYFSNLGPGGKSPVFDQSQYDKVNLGPLSASLWAPKRGAQGPMREDDNSKLAMQARDLERQLGPVGGRNTP